MIATLNTFRHTLEDLGGGLGLTDPGPALWLWNCGSAGPSPRESSSALSFSGEAKRRPDNPEVCYRSSWVLGSRFARPRIDNRKCSLFVLDFSARSGETADSVDSPLSTKR